MNQEVKKNPPAASALIINLAMLMSTGMFLLLTFMLPPKGGLASDTVAVTTESTIVETSEGTEATTETPDPMAKVFFYMGLGMALVGLAIGHTARGGGSAAMQKHIIALALIEICAVMGLLLHITQGDTERARSMIILGIIGVGSLLLNMKNFKPSPEPN